MNAQNIGSFIKELRKEKGLTQKELAEKLNCTDKAISRWETGRGIPEISFLLPLSEILGVSVNEILSGEIIEDKNLKQAADNIVINTIKDANKKSFNLKIIIFSLVCILQFFVTYLVPATASPGDEMGIVFLLFIGTLVDALILGFSPLSLRMKAIFPLIAILLYIPSVFLLPIYVVDFELFSVYIPIILAFSFFGILSATGIVKLITAIWRHFKCSDK